MFLLRGELNIIISGALVGLDLWILELLQCTMVMLVCYNNHCSRRNGAIFPIFESLDFESLLVVMCVTLGSCLWRMCVTCESSLYMVLKAHLKLSRNKEGPKYGRVDSRSRRLRNSGRASHQLLYWIPIGISMRHVKLTPNFSFGDLKRRDILRVLKKFASVWIQLLRIELTELTNSSFSRNTMSASASSAWSTSAAPAAVAAANNQPVWQIDRDSRCLI